MKVDQKHFLEPLLHLFCCQKIQEKSSELRSYINTISGHHNINSWRRRGGMDEMVLAALHLSKATKHLSRCHSNAKLHFSSSVTVHIFAIKILTYSCDSQKCILNIKTKK
jgi:hypothetical protein